MSTDISEKGLEAHITPHLCLADGFERDKIEKKYREAMIAEAVTGKMEL